MISTAFLQVELVEILVIIIITLIIIIPIVVLLSRRKTKPTDDSSLQLFQQQIDNMKTEYGKKFEDMPSEDIVRELKGRMEALTGWSIKSRDEDNRERLEKITEGIKELKKDGKEELVEFAKKAISESTITREEFEDIERRLDKFVGDDTKDENLKFLSELFDSKTQSTISWKCNLIKLLRIGVAPKVDMVKFVHENIPTGEVNNYLKKLVERGIVYKEEIDSFHINENYEWMYSYIDKPAWLKEEFERRELTALKEKDYQAWLKNNLEKVESGLLKEERESTMETGAIDFLCRDVEGKPVGLELKYPEASKADAKQLIAYTKEQREIIGGENFRGIMVAPKIPDSLKKLLSSHELECKEIEFDEP